MKTLHIVIGLAASVVLVGCAHNREGVTSDGYRIGPQVFKGVRYYPAKPGTTYDNVPVDYTTNQPPAGVPDYVTVITTNGIHIHLVDGVASSKK